MDALKFCADPALLDDIKDDPAKLQALSKEIPSYAVEIKLKLKNLDNSLFSYWDIIHAIQEYELVYLTSVHETLSGNNNALPLIPCTSSYFSFPQSYAKLEPGLIDVFGTADQFTIAAVNEEEEKIPYLFISEEKPARFANPSLAQTSSIPTKEQFLERFKIFTNSQLEGWSDWENMVVVGGSVINCLLDIPSEYQDNIADYYHNVAYKTSDIDIYCYGLSPPQYSQKLWKFYQFLLQKHQQKGRKEILVFKTPHTITFATEYPDRHIQFVFGKWDTIEHILFEPDVDCSCFAYQGGADGGKVITTQRGKFSLNHKTIITAEPRYVVRGFPEYESRLVKYSKRGFVIRDEKLIWNNISQYYVKFAKRVLKEHQSIQQRLTICGLRLLVVLHLHKKTLRNTDIMTLYGGESHPVTEAIIEGTGVPYSPAWTMERIREAYNRGQLTVSTNYGCQIQPNTNSFTLLQTIVQANHLFVPYSDLLVSHCNQLQFKKEVQGEGESDNEYEWRMASSHYWYQYIFMEDYQKEVVRMKQSAKADPGYSYARIVNFYKRPEESADDYNRDSFLEVLGIYPEEDEGDEEEDGEWEGEEVVDWNI